MSAQDLEQRARELLAAEWERDGRIRSADHIRTQPLLPNKARAVRAIVAALRQQPAPTIRDRELDRKHFTDASFNEWLDTGISDAGHTVWDAIGDTQAAWAGWDARPFAGDAVMLSECCGREECGGECGNDWLGIRMYRKPNEQPVPVVDDARMARALEWVRAECGFYNNAEARTHLPAIEEAIAAYTPNCGARTVRVVDVSRMTLRQMLRLPGSETRAQGVQS